MQCARGEEGIQCASTGDRKSFVTGSLSSATGPVARASESRGVAADINKAKAAKGVKRKK
jgi:hypothetical protein